ncbi:methyltransferase-like protein 25B isoform X2 [Haemaphysalis longicornis]
METPEYLSRCVEFLREFSWIYDTRMTDLLVAGTLDRVPAEWVEHIDQLSDEELGQVPFGLVKDEWPGSLRAFVSRALDLGTVRFLEPPSGAARADLPAALCRGLTPKKRLELQWFAALVADVCSTAQCGRVLDVGAGVGHLARMLHHSFGLTVVGVDCDPAHVSRARERLLRSPSCRENVRHEVLRVDESAACIEQVQRLLNGCPDRVACACGDRGRGRWDNQFPKADRWVLVSLHACGQLSPTLVRLYHALPQVQALVCIGCCYHKAPRLTDYFPLSCVLLGGAGLGEEGALYQGLRLACEGLRDAWEPGREPPHLLYRALLQMACTQGGLPWSKSRRHVARHAQLSSWDAYRDHVMQDVACCSDAERDAWRGLLDGLHAKHQALLPTVRALTAPSGLGKNAPVVAASCQLAPR